MSKKTFYITSPIYYPNAKPHMGHAYSTLVCDVLARYHRLIGDKTYFLTGTDENTEKVVKAAQKADKDPKEFVDSIVETFKNFYKNLDISYDQFIRTSDEKVHWPGAIVLWNKLVEKGDIYKGSYNGLYCVDCEAFYTEKDLVLGKCPYHGTEPKLIQEENYFFKLSHYTEKIKDKILSREINIIPDTRRNEILALLERGLQDVSFSRPTKEIPWGIPIPNDSTQRMYVWCDALTNYISALGFGTPKDDLYKAFWPTSVHIVGKDITRFHAAIWPAMLLSAGLPLPKTILAHGLILSGGKKMSKSLGNILDPEEFLKRYGTDALRFYLIREISLFEDGEMTEATFKDSYNANLANGLGNLTSRIMKMAETNLSGPVIISETKIPEEYTKAFESFDIQKAAHVVWNKISLLDQKIQETQPFKLVKTDKEKGIQIITELVQGLFEVAELLTPLLPETSQKIKELIKANKPPEVPLFLRKD